MIYRISNKVSGETLWEDEAESADDALDKMAVEAGYPDWPASVFALVDPINDPKERAHLLDSARFDLLVEEVD